MMNQTTLRYNEPLLRAAVRAFCVRAIVRGLGLRFFVVLAIAIACATGLVAQRERGWAVPFMLATLLFVVLFIVSIYVAHMRNTLGTYRRMRRPEGTLSFDEEQFTLASELGSATLPWSAVTEVWRYPRFWLLLLSRNQFVTLPVECLDQRAREFITRKTGG
jgi:hypothetical protein